MKRPDRSPSCIESSLPTVSTAPRRGDALSDCCAHLFAIAAHPAAGCRSAGQGSGRHRGRQPARRQKYLEKLDEYLASAKKEIPPEAVGFRYQIEARYHQERGKEADALKALRQACLVHPGGKPNPKLLGEGPLVDTYYAVCTEVQQRAEVDLATLELPDAPVRIDGLVPGGEYPVLQGRHLVQVQCANDAWSTSGPSSAPAEGCRMPRWCPGRCRGRDVRRSDGHRLLWWGRRRRRRRNRNHRAWRRTEAPPDEPVEEAAPAEPPAPAPEPTTESASPQPRPRNYSLTVQCTPDPCTVKLDGADQGATDLDLKVGLGEHATRAGDKTSSARSRSKTATRAPP